MLDRDDQALAQRLLEHYKRGDSILLLFRKSSDKLLISEHLQSLISHESGLEPQARRFKQLTYHSAKGLQADAVFLLGDCQHVTSSPYKNQVYRMAGLGRSGDAQPFDNAQKDEILRLAYVAITRTVKHCYWYVDAANGDTANMPRASQQVNAEKPCFVDLRGQEKARQ
ncbi:RecBCD enzyme subunit RecB [compost metagenome]